MNEFDKPTIYEPDKSYTSENSLTDEQLKILSGFKRKLLDNMVDSPPEFSKVIDDNYWDLI